MTPITGASHDLNSTRSMRCFGVDLFVPVVIMILIIPAVPGPISAILVESLTESLAFLLPNFTAWVTYRSSEKSDKSIYILEEDEKDLRATASLGAASTL
jgi:hypothetical protein